MRFSMLYSGEQFLSFKSCLVFYAGDSLNYRAEYLGQSIVNITCPRFCSVCGITSFCIKDLIATTFLSI